MHPVPHAEDAAHAPRNSGTKNGHKLKGSFGFLRGCGSTPDSAVGASRAWTGRPGARARASGMRRRSMQLAVWRKTLSSAALTKSCRSLELQRFLRHLATSGLFFASLQARKLGGSLVGDVSLDLPARAQKVLVFEPPAGFRAKPCSRHAVTTRSGTKPPRNSHHKKRERERDEQMKKADTRKRKEGRRRKAGRRA